MSAYERAYGKPKIKVAKIEKVDEDERLVYFNIGEPVRILRGWKRLGGAGWVAGEQTYRSIREAAHVARRLNERQKENA